MRLSMYSDYALRLLVYAALRHPQRVSVGDVAAAYDISRHHLTKIANDLGRNGFLKTVRGRNGGFQLPCDPKDIGIGQVARLTERGIAFVECFDPATNRCVITPACQLKHMLAKAEAAFFEALDAYTLADFAANKPMLARLLEIPASD